jgi:urease accessory protein
MNYLLWQLADSGFPAGGFAHSGGLEAAMQNGYVIDAAGVQAFARHAVLQAGRGALPVITAAHRRPERLAELDSLSDAFLTNPVANRASRAQGGALLGSAARSFPHASIDLIRECVEREALAAHHAPLFGVIACALQLTLPDAQRLSLYLAGRGVGAAAVRLGLIGAYDAQALQLSLVPHIEQTLQRCANLDAMEIGQAAPLNDLYQSTHDRLYSRLFQS